MVLKIHSTQKTAHNVRKLLKKQCFLIILEEKQKHKFCHFHHFLSFFNNGQFPKL